MFILQNSTWKKRVAAMLCTTLLFGYSEAITGFATGKDLPVLRSGKIIELLELSPDEKSVKYGTPESALQFPDTLIAMVEARSYDGTPSNAAKGSEEEPAEARVRVDSWVCETIYDAEEPGDYEFFPEFSIRYELDDVTLPIFTITVEEAVDRGELKITVFAPLEASVKQQRVELATALEDLDLPDTLKAYGYYIEDEHALVSTSSEAYEDTGGDSEQPELIKIENVTWEIDPENERNNGADEYDGDVMGAAYYFTPVLPGGYVLEDDAVLPEIRVMVGSKLRSGVTVVGGFTVVGGTLNTDYSYSSNTLTIKTSTPLVIKCGDTDIPPLYLRQL